MHIYMIELTHAYFYPAFTSDDSKVNQNATIFLHLLQRTEWMFYIMHKQNHLSR
jgi:hypothetical protein